MQKIYDFDFYEHDENIPIPLSFKHIAIQDDGTYIYGNHTYGRSIRWEYVPFFNRHGWVIKKIQTVVSRSPEKDEELGTKKG